MPATVETQSKALLASPAGCAFLLIVERDDVPPQKAVTPKHAMQIAAAALKTLEPWRGDMRETLDACLKAGGRLDRLARDLVSQPGAQWWWAPLDPCRQVWIPMGNMWWAGRRMARQRPHRRFDLARGEWLPPRQQLPADISLKIETPSGSPDSWAGVYYGENFNGWQATSTAMAGVSCWEVMILAAVGEWHASTRPPRVAVGVDADARVFEIQGPDDWHELCRRYRVEEPAGHHRHPLARRAATPHWAQAAADWDGIHLTFGGLLTAPWVVRETAGVRSMLWSWNTEWTLWLRDDVLSMKENLGPLMVDFLAPHLSQDRSGRDYLAHHVGRLGSVHVPESVEPALLERIMDGPLRNAGYSAGPGGIYNVQVQTDAGEVRFSTSEPWMPWELDHCIEFVNRLGDGDAAVPSYLHMR